MEDFVRIKRSNIRNILIVLIIIAAIGFGYWIREPTGFISSTRPSAVGSGSVGTSGDTIANPTYGHVHALAYIPETKTLLLGAHYGLFKSKDSGSTFQKIKPGGYWPVDDVMALVIHPSNNNVVFAAGHDLGVVKSNDGGESFERSDFGIQGSDIHGLTLNQRNPNYLFAFSVGYGVFRSTDGGNSWKRMDDGPENPGVRSLAYMAVQTDMDKNMRWDNWGLLFVGTSGGLYESFSCFCGWVPTTDYFSSSTVYSLATHHSDLRTMYAATKDGLFKSLNEGKDWAKLNGMTTGKRFAALAIDTSDINHVFAATEDGLIVESNDAGKTWMLK